MGVNLFAMNHELLWEDPDIYVIRVPFANFGLEHTNCYVVRDGDEALVIDVGVISPAARKAITKAVADIGVDLSTARFFCTHLHFDHVALIKKASAPGSHIVMSRTAFELNPRNNYRARRATTKRELNKEGIKRFAKSGLAAVMAESRVCDLAGRVYECVGDGDVLRVGKHELRVIETPGHAVGHLCLYSDEQQFLFSGDHILEKTTPGLALPHDGHDTVAEYLDSLNKVDNLPVRVVFPGHGEAFFTLHDRCAALREHHAMRMGNAYELIALNPGISGNDLVRKMPWKRSGPFKQKVWDRLNAHMRLSLGVQTLAYLEYLVNLGEIVREEVDGVNRYHVV